MTAESVRKQRSCSTSPTPTQDQGETKQVLENQGPEGSKTSGEAGNNGQNKAKGKIKNTTVTRLAQDAPNLALLLIDSEVQQNEYQRQKEINIAKNKQVLKELFGDDVWGKGKAEKGKGKKKNTRYYYCHQSSYRGVVSLILLQAVRRCGFP